MNEYARPQARQDRLIDEEHDPLGSNDVGGIDEKDVVFAQGFKQALVDMLRQFTNDLDAQVPQPGPLKRLDTDVFAGSGGIDAAVFPDGGFCGKSGGNASDLDQI